MYKLTLKTTKGEVVDVRDVQNDGEALETIGVYAINYWLALERVDCKDAYRGAAVQKKDALLAFTVKKANDEPGCSRHGLPRGVLATGKCVYWGTQNRTGGDDCMLTVEEVR